MARTVTAILRDIKTVEESKHLDDTTREKIIAQFKAELAAMAAALPGAAPPKPPK